MYLYRESIFKFILDVVVGWKREVYEFDEYAFQAHICAAVLQGSLAITLPSLNIMLRNGTASQDGLSVRQDYVPTLNPADHFNFSSTNFGPICVTISILNDNLLELTIEDFFADLAFATHDKQDRVTISPATTRVYIIDDDSKCFTNTGSHFTM